MARSLHVLREAAMALIAGAIWAFPAAAQDFPRTLNIYVGYGPGVQIVHNAFVASPHHYENLVEPSYNLIGIGVTVLPSSIQGR